MPARLVVLAALAIVLAWAATDWSPPGEFLAMPGKVIAGHEKWEPDCGACHKRFHRGEQSSLCVSCHKGIRTDIRDGRFHAFVAGKACSECHPDHQGRNASAVAFDPSGFDHDKSRYKLRETHANVKCASCHRLKYFSRMEHRGCSDCHGNDRRMEPAHHQRYGDDCGKCHAATAWKDIRFQHDCDTTYRLLAKHRDAKCDACHMTGAELRRRGSSSGSACADCRRKEKIADLHRRKAAGSCDSCHRDTTCGEIRAQRPDTRDGDAGVRQTVPLNCDSCHLQGRRIKGRTGKIDSRCITCHARDDMKRGHRGAFGERCQACHDERGWRPWG